MATVNGTDNSETLDADDGVTGGADFIFGEGGADEIFALGGEDIVFGGTGGDSLHGGAGDDLFIWFNGDGSDVVNGGAGLDRQMVAGSNNNGDQLTLSPNGSAARLARVNLSLFNLDLTSVERIDVLAGDGNNTFTIANLGTTALGSGLITYEGGSGIDIVNGSATATALKVLGRGGIDNLTGGSADDELEGGGESDNLNGASGNDLLSGGAGGDGLTGGLGIDTASYATSGAGVSVSLSTGAGTGGEAAGDLLVAIENIIGGAFGDALTGDGTDNDLNGNDGNDTLDGKAGNDNLTGGAGADGFLFSVALKKGNVDAMADFSAVDDTILLDNAIFKKLKLGELKKGAFFAKKNADEAKDDKDRIVVDTKSGECWYDKDGKGGAKAKLFAVLDGSPGDVSHTDFVVIA